MTIFLFFKIQEMIFKQKIKENLYQVMFKDPLPMDSGKYKIHAQNPVGECSTECDLKITSPPFFEKELKDVELRYNHPDVAPFDGALNI